MGGFASGASKRSLALGNLSRGAVGHAGSFLQCGGCHDIFASGRSWWRRLFLAGRSSELGLLLSSVLLPLSSQRVAPNCDVVSVADHLQVIEGKLDDLEKLLVPDKSQNRPC